MIPQRIQVGKRKYNVSSTTRQGRETAKAPKGKVYLTTDSGDTFLVQWPLRLHSETDYQVIKPAS